MSGKLRIWVVALWSAGHERNYRREGSAWHKSLQGYYQIFQCLNLLNLFPGNCNRAGLPGIFKAGLKNYRTYGMKRLVSLIRSSFLPSPNYFNLRYYLGSYGAMYLYACNSSIRRLQSISSNCVSMSLALWSTGLLLGYEYLSHSPLAVSAQIYLRRSSPGYTAELGHAPERLSCLETHVDLVLVPKPCWLQSACCGYVWVKWCIREFLCST